MSKISSSFTLFITEIKSISSIAYPILVAFLSHLLIGFTDNVMAGRFSSVDLAAVSIGSAIWLPLYLFFSSILSGLTPLLAKSFAENNRDKSQELYSSGLTMAIHLSIINILIISLLIPMINFFVTDINLRTITIKYLFYILFGLPGFLFYQVVRSSFEAKGETTPIMFSSFLGLIINIPLNYIFIYGRFGIPPFGGAGCGIATTLSIYNMLLLLYIFHKRTNDLFYTKYDFKTIIYLFRFGLPIGISTFLEAFIFSFGSILLSPFGYQVVASHQIALNFISTIFMIPLSLGIAISVRVSQQLGKNNLYYSTKIWKSGIIFVEIVALFSSIIIYLLSDYILKLYTNDQNVIRIAYPLLILSICFHIIDAFQVTANNILKGYHNTKFPMFVSIFSYWSISLPLGLLFVFYFKLSAFGFWLALIIGVVLAAVILGHKLFSKYNFKNM